jgi:DNA-binding PadR family transcriptional regulator
MSGDPTGDTPNALTPLWSQILLALADGERYGYDILKEIERQTDGRMSPKTGSLYAALQRLVEEGLIRETPGVAEPGEDGRRRYYGVTDRGREAIRSEIRRLARIVSVAARKNLLPELEAVLPAEGMAG